MTVRSSRHPAEPVRGRRPLPLIHPSWSYGNGGRDAPRAKLKSEEFWGRLGI
jgi:hypothetical protein